MQVFGARFSKNFLFVHVITQLTGKKLPIIIGGMDAKKWFGETLKRPIYDKEIADILGVTRKTANKRLNDGLSADDLIALCDHYGVNPVKGLVDLEHVTEDSVFEYLEVTGEFIDSASEAELVLELAKRIIPYKNSEEIQQLEHAVKLLREKKALQESAPVTEISTRWEVQPPTANERRGLSAQKYDLQPTVGDIPTWEELNLQPGEYAADSSPDEDYLRELEEHGGDWTDPNNIP